MPSYRYFRCQIIILLIPLLLFVSGVFITVDAFLAAPIRFVGSSINTCLPAKRPSSDTSSVPDITRRMLSITKNPNVAFVIDLENVRGKTSFELDHDDLLDRLMVWTSLRNFAKGRTMVVVDHGRRSSAHLLHGHVNHHHRDEITDAKKPDDNASMCISFAGPRVKADDIIARDVKWLLSSPESTIQHIVLITADQNLTYRCRNAVRMAGRNRSSVPFSIDSVAHNSILRSFLDDSKRSNGRRRGRVKQAKEGGRKKKSRAARKLQTSKHGGVMEEEDEADDKEGEEEEGAEQDEDGNEIDTNVTDTTINITSVAIDEHQPNNLPIPTIEVISPQRFLEDLGQSLHEWLQREKGKYASSVAAVEYTADDDATTISSSENNNTPVHSSQSLFQLRQKILALENSLRSTCTLHKRKGLTGELRKCKEEWKAAVTSIVAKSDAIDWTEFGGDKHALLASLACTFSSATLMPKSDSDGNATTPSALSSSTAWERLATREQDKLLMATRQENTGDRVVLAERLRKQLLVSVSRYDDEHTPNQSEEQELIVGGADTTSTTTLAKVYAEYINGMLTGPD
ncbi:hypothetical protein ACHAWU_009133 [Discostella pseudostelligera]|uniref:Transmembrane protein n=1 Tax=Discostella pseudostelligera TaxID=259834 RepID=A0ABD3N268_9STRA